MKILKIYSKRNATVYEYEVGKNDIDTIRQSMSLTEGQCRTVLSMMEGTTCRYIKIDGDNNSKSLAFGSGESMKEYQGGLPLSDANAIPETEEFKTETETVGEARAEDKNIDTEESSIKTETASDNMDKPKKVKRILAL